MRIRLLLAAAGLVTLAACSEAPTAPTQARPGDRSDDIICNAGYVIATLADGTQTCEPAQQSSTSAKLP